MKKIIGSFLTVLLSISSISFADQLEKADFGAGCFWGTEEFFRKVPGVVKTTVGYEGGDRKASYPQVSSGVTGHAETLQVEFDPKVVSYEKLLDLFFKMHDPTKKDQQGNDVGSQYRSVIFAHGDEQMKEAKAFKQKVEKSNAWGAPITTEITNSKTFYEAEPYHQKYLVNNPGGYDNHKLRDLNFDVRK